MLIPLHESKRNNVEAPFDIDDLLSMTSIAAMPGNYLTTRQAARLLGVSVRTVQLWVDTGKLMGWVTKGGHRRLARASVLDVLAKDGKSESGTVSRYRLPLLIVEDDMAIIKLYQLHIKTWPFDVQTFVTPNGYEALVLAGEMNPAMLICDLRLPGINGFQVVRALAKMDRFSKLHMVVVSGLPEDEIEAHGGLPPGVEIMGKPIDFKRLQAIAQKQWEVGLQGQ